jgi:hypothetical protein
MVVIGGAGKMGSWFVNYFSSRGFPTAREGLLSIDPDYFRADEMRYNAYKALSK